MRKPPDLSWRNRLIWRIRRQLRLMYRPIASKFVEYTVPAYTDMPNIWRSLGAKVGSNVDIDPSCVLDRNFGALLEIKDNVVIAMGSAFLLHDSSINNVTGGPIKVGKTVVESGAYIGAYTIVMPGVVIGERSIIGAGSLITKDVPRFTVAVGRPASPLCTLQDLDRRFRERASEPSERFAYYDFPSQVEQGELSPEELKAWTLRFVRELGNGLQR